MAHEPAPTHPRAHTPAHTHAQGKFVITLGGDHSIAIGTVTGILRARPDTGIVWVDAHGDINTPATSSSGNLHGMCVSFAMGHVDLKPLPQFAWLDALLKQGARACICGGRPINAMRLPGQR